MLKNSTLSPKLSKNAQKRAARTARRQEQSQSTPLDVGVQPEGSSKVIDIQSATGTTANVSPLQTSTENAQTKVPPTKGAVVRGAPMKVEVNTPQVVPAISFTPLLSPTVRKRKASQDLASSPFSKEFKFEQDDFRAANLEASKETKEDERAKKLRNVGTRTLWTLIMISGFLSTFCYQGRVSFYTTQHYLALLAMGHAYMILLILLCQSIVYREVTSLFTLLRGDSDSDEELWRKTLNWYFFAVANYFLYGESIISYFKVS